MLAAQPQPHAHSHLKQSKQKVGPEAQLASDDAQTMPHLAWQTKQCVEPKDSQANSALLQQ
jgi:hypothetical protein